MVIRINKWILLIVLVLHAQQSLSEQKQINIAAIDWCPQICPKNISEEGYLVDIVRQIYGANGYQINLDYFPWSRAIMLTRSGKYEALLSPAKPEAPDLIYPDLPIGQQRMCFFVRANDSWMYEDLFSLDGRINLLARDTSIEALNDYIKRRPNQFQFMTYSGEFIEQAANLLTKKRIDTFVFTRNTSVWELGQLNIKQQVREAGCISKENIYLAFSPSAEQRYRVSKLIGEFDKHMAHLRESGTMNKILANYELTESVN